MGLLRFRQAQYASPAQAEATKFLDAIKKSGKVYDTNNDGKLSQAEFTQACKDGVFASIK